MNLRKDHYRTSLTVLKTLRARTRIRSQGLYGKMGPLPPAALAVGLFPESQTLHVSSASLGYLRPARVESKDYSRSSLLRRFKESVSLPPHDAQPFFNSLVTKLESPNLEGGSGDAPHSDGRRVLAVAATCRPVKQKYNS